MQTTTMQKTTKNYKKLLQKIMQKTTKNYAKDYKILLQKTRYSLIFLFKIVQYIKTKGNSDDESRTSFYLNSKLS